MFYTGDLKGMTPRDLGKWIRQEHAEVQALSDRLRECVAIVPRCCSDDWICNVRERFERFRAHLQKHIALEEREGYMAAVLELRPTMSGRVKVLEQEHQDLVRLLDGLHALVVDLSCDRPLLVKDFCGRVDALLGYVEKHEGMENDLAEFVFTQDMGSE
ncbi:MAG: hypothetical protein GXP29_05075 [Planctomycetes bacterium]|nr:hypothetical protein [Planctomycetota bacterium]